MFDGTLKQALAVKLGESKRVRVVSRERVAQALRLMRQPPQTPVNGQVAREVCQRVRGDTVLSGEIARMGEEFVVLIEVTGCASATPIAQARAEAAGKGQVLRALDRVAVDLMARLGEGAQAAGASTRSIEDVTTANLEALRTYSLASDALAERKVAEAIALYDHAIGLDPYENGGVFNLVALRGDVAELGVFRLRGLARLALGHGDLAAAEFQKIIDRRSVSPLSPYCALAFLNLARSRALDRNLAAARKAYEEFFSHWAAADPGLPLLAEAKRTYQELTAGRAESAR